MATFIKRIGWLAVMAAVLVVVPLARADGDGSCDNSGGGSPDNSAYWSAYQQWLQWQQQVYTDRRHDWEQQQEQLKQARLDRQLYHPPVTEIWAAEPLNALLIHLQDLENHGTQLPEVDIADKVMAHVNLTSGVSAGNIGVLKNNGVLDWPMALRQPQFKGMEDQLGSVTQRLVAGVKAGDINADEYHTAVTLVDQAKSDLLGEVRVMSSNDYIQAKRYLNDLGDAIKVLSQPDAASYFGKDYAARGHNVKTLVEYMSSKGLKFAPAAAQDKAAYLALHQALASCFMAVGDDAAL